MGELSHALILLLLAALAVLLVQHGWGGVRAKLSAVFLGKARPDLVR